MKNSPDAKSVREEIGIRFRGADRKLRTME